MQRFTTVLVTLGLAATSAVSLPAGTVHAIAPAGIWG
jgi:hypothetical protein